MRVTEICRYATQPINKLIEDLHNLKEATDLMLQGTALHSMILRKNRWEKEAPADIEVLDFLNYRTKEAQEIKANAINQGKTPILKKDFLNLQRGLAFLLKDLDKIFINGGEYEKELSGDVGNFKNIVGHLDYINEKEVIDLKITSKCDDFSKIIFDSGYQLQVYLYMCLAGLENARIVFINPNSLTIDVVNLDKHTLKTECDELLELAEAKMIKVLKAESAPLVSYHTYETPQWAYAKMLKDKE